MPTAFRRVPSCLVIVCLAVVLSADAADRPPNVVLFVVDDMGWIDCGAYGSEYYETPNIDRLASRGMLFTDAYSANPLCSPTRASILTGKYPARLGITSAVGHRPPLPHDEPRMPETAAADRPIIQPESLRYLDPDEYTLAEAFRDAGYATGHFGKWHLGLTEEYWPEAQGYEVAFHGAPDPGPPSPNGYFSPYSFKAGTVTPGAEGEYIVDRVGDEAVRFIEAHRDRPFLASVWQYGVHGPWDYKEEYAQPFVGKVDPRGKQNNPVMAAMLKSVDECLGRIVDTLDRLGLTDETIILFTSDNGGNVHSNTADDRRKENVDEKHPQWRSISQYRKYAGFNPPTNNAPLRAGKGTLYEGGVRIPFIAVWPGHIPPESRSTQIISTIDIYPTLTQLAAVPVPDAQTFDGVSLASLLKGNEAAVEREAVFNFFPHGGPAKPPGVTVRRGDWKLIRWFETGPDYPSLHELYNLRDDLGETTNRAADRPELVAELDRLIDQFLADTGALYPLPNPAFQPGEAAPRTPKQQRPLLGWVGKSCDARLTDRGLEVVPSGRMPFIARTGLRGEGTLEIRATLSAAAAGTGRLQWRTASQESFPETGQTADFELASGEQTVTVPFTVTDPLLHLRLHVPAGRNALTIDRIELWQSADEPVRLFEWNFRNLAIASTSASADDPNLLTDAEKAAGFEPLFNGSDLESWTHGGNWKVEEGVITRDGQGGSLVYAAKPIPDDFELRFQWKVAEGSNSGVYYRPTQYEYQILDNAGHADGKNPRTSAASLYFCMAPSRDATKPVGEWNEGRIICRETVIQHWLNGRKVIDFDYTDPQWAFNVNLLNQRGGDLTARGANLSLQDHGDPVWYRGIKLRELPPGEQLDRTPVQPAEIPEDVLKAEAEKLRGIVERRNRQNAR